MAATAPKLSATLREEKGKGAARRTRREGNVPAVLYGHGEKPRHLAVSALEFAAILRKNGVNAAVELDIDGEKQLALTWQVDVQPVRSYIEHADFLIVRRGEKVVVEVVVVVEGDALGGTVVTQDAGSLQVEAEALAIPEQFVVSVEGATPGFAIHAGDIELPEGVTLVSPDDTLVVAVNEAKAATESEDEAGEGEAAAAEAPAEDAGE